MRVDGTDAAVVPAGSASGVRKLLRPMGRTYQTLAPLADQTGHHCCVGLTRKALTELGWNDATIDLWIAEVPQIEVEDAVGWRSLGVGPETAAWYADVRPSIADEWLAHGFTVDEMVRCHRSRVTLVRAVEWRAAGRPLDETVLWGSHGFSPDEADEWRSDGHDVRSAHEARRNARVRDKYLKVAALREAMLREPIDVPDDARDREAELAEMWPHLRDPAALGDLWADVRRPSSD